MTRDEQIVEVLPLPTDEATLVRVLRDLFESHWDKNVFGPIIQGAAWEFQAPHAPSSSVAWTIRGCRPYGVWGSGTAVASSKPPSSSRPPTSPWMTRRSSGSPTGRAWRSGMGCGHAAPGDQDPIRSTDPSPASATIDNTMHRS
jgi:hypothetical protein